MISNCIRQMIGKLRYIYNVYAIIVCIMYTKNDINCINFKNIHFIKSHMSSIILSV